MTAGAQERDWIFISDVVDGLLAIRDADLSPGLTVELGQWASDQCGCCCTTGFCPD